MTGHEVAGYPTLVPEGPAGGTGGIEWHAGGIAGGTVGVAVFDSAVDQRRSMRAGTAQLLATALAPSLTRIRQSLTRDQQITLATAPDTTIGGLVADATRAAVDALLDWAGGPAWTAAGFDAVRARRCAPARCSPRSATCWWPPRRCWPPPGTPRGPSTCRGTGPGGGGDRRPDPGHAGSTGGPPWRPGSSSAAGAAGLPDRARHLQALRIRAERVREARRPGTGSGSPRSGDLQAEVRPGGRRPAGGAPVPTRTSRAVHSLLAEYRVALFAQPMRTSVPVSAKRIRAAVAALRLSSPRPPGCRNDPGTMGGLREAPSESWARIGARIEAAEPARCLEGLR